MEFSVRPYTPEMEAEWDRFVMKESGNGTFLQTRNFSNYHPAGRFEDASLVVVNEKDAVVAVVPAAVQLRDGKRTFVSHPGSTYGGPVIRTAYNTAARTIGILQAVDRYIAANYEAALFHPTVSMLEGEENQTLLYAFSYLNYTQFTELNTWVPLEGKNPDSILASFRQDKRQNVKKAMKHDLTFRRLETKEEVETFHALLAQNLAKYDVKPVHTAAELWDFKTNRLKKETNFYGVFEQDRMVAGGMTFFFAQSNVMHTQYLSADLSIRSYSPAAYLYYQVLCDAAAKGCKALSWGISTEDHGKVLNFGLVESKEGYGSRHALTLSFAKEF